MQTTGMPNVRARGRACEGACAGCGSAEFHTEHGTGPLYWLGGVGARLRFGDPEQGERITLPVRCSQCDLAHAPRIELPPLVDERARR